MQKRPNQQGPEQGARGIAKQIQIRRDSGWQKLLREFNRSRQQATRQQRQHRAGQCPTTQQNNAKAQWYISQDIHNIFKRRVVMRKGIAEKGKHRDAQIAPPRKRIEANDQDNQQITGQKIACKPGLPGRPRQKADRLKSSHHLNSGCLTASG